MNSNQQDANAIKIKNEIKTKLINYYDRMRSQIDQCGQQELISKHENLDDNQNELLDVYLQMIDIVQDYFATNMNDVDAYFRNNYEKCHQVTQEEIQLNAIKKFCIYLTNDCFIENNESLNNGLGLLTTFNNYLTDAQLFVLLSLLRNRISENDKKQMIKIDKNLLSIICFAIILKTTNNDTIKANIVNFDELDIIKQMQKYPVVYGIVNYLRSFNIESLKSNCFTNFNILRRFDLSGNKISSGLLENGIFYGLDNLESLFLRNCNISVIQDDAFSSLSNLKTLDLNGNKIEQLDDFRFKFLYKLTFLDLGSCMIRKINENAFVGLDSLEFMDLSQNKIESIDKKAFSLRRLTRLYLDLCAFKLDNHFQNMISLEILDLSNNIILNLHENFLSGIENLVELDLENCGIQAIADNSFIQLYSLISLNLSKNDIQTLHANVFNGLSKLKLLNLAYNPIRISFDFDLLDFFRFNYGLANLEVLNI